jgi:hypothetical protein
MAQQTDHIGDTNKMVEHHIGDTNKMIYQVTDVEKLAEEVYGKGVNQDYEEGYVDGYNKAKETLYTDEQVREAMEFARGHSRMTDTEFIKSLRANKL